jgi:hypothetical protein
MIMSIILRIVLTALCLIFTHLILYDFQPGGRYLILVEAIVTGFIAHWIRLLIRSDMDYRLRSMLSAGGLIFGLGLTRLVFSGIRLTIPGILLVYSGLILVELILPEDLRKVNIEG